MACSWILKELQFYPGKMAKMKADGSKKVSHPHLYARLSFLHQAAQLLESQELSKAEAAPHEHKPVAQQHEGIDFEAKSNAIARELSYHSSVITRKSKLHIEPSIKRTICKRCSSKLIEGPTSFSRIENKSCGGLKSWADVLVVTCLSCKMQKRFPIGQARGQKKLIRETQTTSELAAQNEVNSWMQRPWYSKASKLAILKRHFDAEVHQAVDFARPYNSTVTRSRGLIDLPTEFLSLYGSQLGWDI